MLAAWPKIFSETGVKLKIVGDGPLRPAVETAVKNCNGIEFIGWLDLRKENYATIGSAKALIFPSIWYETQGMTIVESMAAGTPVIASRLGSRAEMIAEGRTGFLFESGNPDDIARAVRLFLSSQTDTPQMRAAARAEFEARYTAEQNYPLLVKCYETALADR
jgi:glycosyltransferase involved in cell wall biosynthesis